MQQASSSVLTLYAILHWGPGGEGTGYTIVAARSENMARQFAAIHLRANATINLSTPIGIASRAAPLQIMRDKIRLLFGGMRQSNRAVSLKRPHRIRCIKCCFFRFKLLCMYYAKQQRRADDDTAPSERKMPFKACEVGHLRKNLRSKIDSQQAAVFVTGQPPTIA